MKVDLEWVGVLRHGESTGNVAREVAETAGADVIDLAERDADVPLTGPGRDQAAAAGELLAGHRPDVVVTSTYRRAWDTAKLAAPAGVAIVPDERLRDRELGVLDLLTSHGVRERWPDEARRKRRLGRFYYRPPGGESWADVVLRVRSLLAELSAERPGARVLLSAHEMTVFALRYLLEGLPEPDLMRAAAATAVPNGSLTTWERDRDGGFTMVLAQRT
ncbi:MULTISPECIES: histidine phosphatase family protein [unclassified Amycolatopsis]|uniref:histidine phosphatase family protein n=1 Tax=unclassified Amycolatopsis TaxID=2618356 RepID=UPI002E14E801|nr:MULTISPECIES: histidine phosphatase family protein [unclassified Amycolatopsis]WSJ81365.1 histidine phosphatase family protein [Amycolatopsis sp. NBC_01307]WSK75260.1 histidine phosphatase family protein [Amycolatopsis sp. NBC_01286]